MEDRNGVRTPMQWDDSPHGGFSTSNIMYAPVVNTRDYGPHKVNVQDALKDPGSLFNVLRNMLMRRRKHQALGSGKLLWLDNTDKAVAAWIRYYGMDAVLVVSNLSDRPKTTRIHVPKRFSSVNPAVDLLTGEKLEYQNGKLCDIQLEAYQFKWIDLALI
jgi:glycosidase